MRKYLGAFILAFFLFATFLTVNTKADIGPKPTSEISFKFNGQGIPDASFIAKMLACFPQKDAQSGMMANQNLIPQMNITEYDVEKNCYWQPSALAWGGDCSASTCRFTYFMPDEFKLAVYIPSLDKTFITNAIARENFDSQYMVELFTDGSAKISEGTWLSLTLVPSKVFLFIIAFAITLVLEFLLTLFFVLVFKFPNKLLKYIFLVNLITLPLVWFIFPFFVNETLSLTIVTLVAEVFAVLVEAYLLYRFSKKTLPLKSLLLLSLLNNLASFFAGEVIFQVLVSGL